MDTHYNIIQFGNRRVVLHGTKGAGTMTQHVEGHITWDFSGYDVIGIVTVPDDGPEPSLSELLSMIDKGYAPGYNAPLGWPDAKYIGETRNGLKLIPSPQTLSSAPQEKQ